MKTDNPSAYRLLLEANTPPFAPCERTRPVVNRIAGRATNGDVEPEHWIQALEETDGSIAIYFYISGDHEWWIAYEHDRDVEDEQLEGPFHLWNTYPSGGWTHKAITREIILAIVEELYLEGDSDIYRSRIVPTWNAPDMVRETIDVEKEVILRERY